MFMHSVSLSHSPKTRHKESSRESGSGILRKGREPRVAWESEEVVRGCLTCMRSPHTSALWVSAALFRLEYGSQTCCHVKQFKKKNRAKHSAAFALTQLPRRGPPFSSSAERKSSHPWEDSDPHGPHVCVNPRKEHEPYSLPFRGEAEASNTVP